MLYLFIGKIAYVLLLGLLMTLLFQKKYGKAGEKKRYAVLYIGLAVLAVYAVSFLHAFPDYASNPLPLIIVLTATGSVLYLKREKTFPFRSRCIRCGKKLTLERRFFLDDNLCETCGKNSSSPFSR